MHLMEQTALRPIGVALMVGLSTANGRKCLAQCSLVAYYSGAVGAVGFPIVYKRGCHSSRARWCARDRLGPWARDRCPGHVFTVLGAMIQTHFGSDQINQPSSLETKFVAWSLIAGTHPYLCRIDLLRLWPLPDASLFGLQVDQMVMCGEVGE